MIDPETSALDIARAVAVGEVSATAVTEAALARIAGLNPLLNAFTDVTAARARTQAEALDARRAVGETLGPLAGVPFAVKNMFDVAGLPMPIHANRGDCPASPGDASPIPACAGMGPRCSTRWGDIGPPLRRGRLPALNLGAIAGRQQHERLGVSERDHRRFAPDIGKLHLR
jgi:hypothetical protein